MVAGGGSSAAATAFAAAAAATIAVVGLCWCRSHLSQDEEDLQSVPLIHPSRHPASGSRRSASKLEKLTSQFKAKVRKVSKIAKGRKSGCLEVGDSASMSSGVSRASKKRADEEESASAEASGSESSHFDCNICFELAQDPVVTLCGHLFCWPCLYKWLQYRTSSKECPVCKAGVEEEKVIPLYGRGKASADPRTKPIPETEIPHRPAGQRPNTAYRADHQQHYSFNFMGGHGTVPVAQFGAFSFSAGFGLFPSLFGVHWHGIGGTGPAFGNSQAQNVAAQAQDHQEVYLSRLLFVVGCLVTLFLTFLSI